VEHFHPPKWNIFSHLRATSFPEARNSLPSSPISNLPVFGIPIANRKRKDPPRRLYFAQTMTQTAQTRLLARSPWTIRNSPFAWGSLFIGALTLAVYYKVIAELVETWWTNPDFSHGFLVPAFAAYMVWTKRAALNLKCSEPSWEAIAIVATGLAILLLGVYGASVFLSRISLVITLAGLILCFGGWALLKQLRFVVLVLLLAIPLPAVIFNQIALPLQYLTAKLASGLLPLVGVPVLRDGNIIQLSDVKLEVAEACSGIRSLVTLFTLAIFYGYFLEKTFVRRLMLALASIPIAIAANAVRIFGTGVCIQYWDPEKALGFFHEFSGWVMFLVSLVCLFIVHRSIQLLSALGERA
jgi:exosortase